MSIDLDHSKAHTYEFLTFYLLIGFKIALPKSLPSAQMQSPGEKGWGKPYEYDYKLYNMTNEEAAKAERYAVEAAKLAGTLDESMETA